MFSQVSVCPQGGVCLWGECLPHPLGRHPPGQTPLGQTPPWQTPLGRHPPGQTPFPGQTPPGQTSPRQTPPCPVHAGIHTPMSSACWDTPPCPVHAGIWSTSGRYASHWDAFLFQEGFKKVSRNVQDSPTICSDYLVITRIAFASPFHFNI